MSLLFESIACREGKLLNLNYHQARLNRSRAELLRAHNLVSLDSIIIPAKARQGLWKCRVAYGYEIEKVEFTPYKAKNARTFSLIEADIDYPHKFEDRAALNDLFQRRNNADDIILVVDGLITDTSYGNLIFSDGKNWLTPMTPLLPGTMRARLLKEGTIRERIISTDDLGDFQKFMMINALNPFDEAWTLPIKNII